MLDRILRGLRYTGVVTSANPNLGLQHPAMRSGLLRPDELSPVQPLPDDPATRDERYTRLAAWLEQWEREAHPDEPEWEVEALFPPDRVR